MQKCEDNSLLKHFSLISFGCYQFVLITIKQCSLFLHLTQFKKMEKNVCSNEEQKRGRERGRKKGRKRCGNREVERGKDRKRPQETERDRKRPQETAKDRNKNERKRDRETTKERERQRARKKEKAAKKVKEIFTSSISSLASIGLKFRSLNEFRFGPILFLTFFFAYSFLLNI